MMLYNVHIHREMRLYFPGIEAATPDEAARIASGKSTDHADGIHDCNGEDLSALIEVAGDDEYEHSVTIDFEAQPRRDLADHIDAAIGKAVKEATAPMIAAIEETLEEIKYWHSDMLSEDGRPPFKRPNGWARVYDKCQAAIGKATEQLPAAKG